MPGDIALILEVSDSTLDHGLGPKAQLYARAGIPEYWVIDVKGCLIYQHREPSADGYASLRVVASADTLSPLAQPIATLTPKLIFGCALPPSRFPLSPATVTPASRFSFRARW